MTIRAAFVGIAAALTLSACDFGSQAEAERAKAEAEKARAEAEKARADAEKVKAEAEAEKADTDPSSAPAAMVEGGLGKEQIRTVVRGHINEIRDCYNEGLSKNPELGGRVVASFKIEADGKVSESSSKETSVDDELTACVVDAVKTWEFPESSEGKSTVVTYPFVLSPG